MNNDIIELFQQMHTYIDAFNENIVEYHEGKTTYMDYSLLQKTFEFNEKLGKYEWGSDNKKWSLYENVSRLISQERYEEIIKYKALIDALETNELLHTDI